MQSENSILTSLTELRAIEKQRQTDEREARDRDAAAREALVLESIKRATAEAEARNAAAASERARADAEVAAERRARDTALACAEIQARVRAEAELAAARLDQEMRIKHEQVARTRPFGMIAVIASLVLAAGGLGVWIVHQSDDLTEQQQRIDSFRASQRDSDVKAAAAAQQMRDTQDTIDAQRLEIEAIKRATIEAQQKHVVVPPPPPIHVNVPPTHVVTPTQDDSKIIKIDPSCKHNSLCLPEKH